MYLKILKFIKSLSKFMNNNKTSLVIKLFNNRWYDFLFIFTSHLDILFITLRINLNLSTTIPRFNHSYDIIWIKLNFRFWSFDWLGSLFKEMNKFASFVRVIWMLLQKLHPFFWNRYVLIYLFVGCFLLSLVICIHD